MNNITKFKIFEKIYKIRKIEIYKLLFSIILSFMMFSYTNKLVYKLLPTREVTISSINKEKKDSYITITQNDETSRFYDLKDIFNKNTDLKEKVDESNNYIIYSDNPETKISFKLKEIPNNEILFKNLGMNEINIKVGHTSKILNMANIVEEGKLYAYFPFQNSKLYFVYSIGIFLILTRVIYTIFNFLNFIVKNMKIRDFLLKYTPKKVFILLYLIVCMTLTISVLGNLIPKTYFVENSKDVIWDQAWYWTMGGFLKNFQFKNLLESFTFRGYFSYLPMTLSQIINDLLKIKFNEYWSFYMLNSSLIILFLSYIIPEIYIRLTKKDVKNYQIIIIFFLFSFFWRGVYYSVLSDMFGVITFFGSILMFLNYINDKKNISAFLSGVLITIASLSRANYKFGIYVIVIIFILKYGFKIFKIKKLNKLKNSFLIYFLLGVILTSFPQAMINFKRGHIGLLPYDEKGAYISTENLTLAEQHVNSSLGTTLVYIYPYKLNADNTALKLKNNYSKEAINMNQVFSMFISNPLDTIILINKKLFYSIDLKTPEMYPSNYKSHTRVYFFSFFNYWIFLTGIYLLKKRRYREKYFSKKELLLGSILIVVFTLPQLLLAIEWRFFIIFYLIAYYIFSFKFTEIIQNEKFDKFKYLNFIILGEILFFVLSSFYFDSII